MSFASVNGSLLHWRADGAADAPTVVFVNSLGSDFRIWDGVTLPGHCVIRYDLRGHGLSGDVAGPLCLDDHVDDLAALLDHLGVTDLALVGLSVGGMIAQLFAARAPERCRALVLCATGLRIGTREAWNTRIDAVRAWGLEAIADAVLERWFTAGFRAERPDEWAGWRNMLVRTPATGYAATCAAIRDADLRSNAAAIRAPCLCLVGDEDAATPPDLMRETADLITGASFEVIERAGHLPCIEQPKHLAGLIRRHLTEAAHG